MEGEGGEECVELVAPCGAVEFVEEAHAALDGDVDVLECVKQRVPGKGTPVDLRLYRIPAPPFAEGSGRFVLFFLR